MTKNLLSASTLLLLCSYIVPSAANSNMVSITHRSSLNGMANDYSSGLNVVKSTNSNNYSCHINQSNDDGSINYYYNNDEPEEYVTDFYRQKRIEKRELAAKAVGMEEANNIIHDDCHSLDHYFDHNAIGVQSGQTGGYSSSGSGGDNDVKRRRGAFFRHSDINSKEYCSHELDDIDDINVKYNTQRPAFLPNGATNHHSRACVASSVRGGSITQQVLNQKQRGNHDDGSIKKNHRGHSRRNHQRRDSQPQKRPSATFAPRHRSHRGNSYAQYQRHDRTRQVSEVDKFNYSDSDTDDSNYEDEYDDHYDYISNHDEEYDDYEANSSVSPHQAGLLRVPCSLRLNSSENTHHHHHSINNYKATPIAAYVDTGAQVTVISATAARRVGILHLMDRRYAGRATGVGHCRVLGRIPAGCVQFVLGDDDDDCDYNDEGGTTTVQMNGPALTVLEGTVTEGVDMLLGLDVLQDWEATIQMGGSARKSSMTVKKRGMSEPVVLPFLVVGDDDDSSRGGDSGKDRRRSRSASSSSAPTTASHGRQQRHSHNRRRHQQRQQHAATKTHHHDDARHEGEVEDNEDDDLFSPILWDIESDLDILDQSEFTHEFPDEGRRRRVKQCSEKIVHDIEREDELLGVRHSKRNYLRNERDGEEEDDDDLLQDSSDDEGNDDEVTFDMSGL